MNHRRNFRNSGTESAKSPPTAGHQHVLSSMSPKISISAGRKSFDITRSVKRAEYLLSRIPAVSQTPAWL
jgi:hypothetical protein